MFFSLMQLSHVKNVMLIEASDGGLILVEGMTVWWEHLGGIFYSLLKCVLYRTQEKRYFLNSRHRRGHILL
jgi:membrane associated rhomboid family serine protease